MPSDFVQVPFFFSPLWYSNFQKFSIFAAAAAAGALQPPSQEGAGAEGRSHVIMAAAAKIANFCAKKSNADSLVWETPSGSVSHKPNLFKRIVGSHER